MDGNENRFLLRLWCDGRAGDPWRANLKDLASDDSWHFASVEQLFAHLSALTTEIPDAEE